MPEGPGDNAGAMTNDIPPRRRTVSLRTQLLSVTAVTVTAFLLTWQLTAWLDRDPLRDGQQVVSGTGTPGGYAGRTSDRPSAGTTAEYDESSPAGLEPQLRKRLARAVAGAEKDGVTVTITSARRSVTKQQQLFREAVLKYGSRRAASRWVLPPADSAHVQGRAVDLGPRDAMRWMDENGWRYGICRRYDNEPWHFEAITRPGNPCPPREPYAVARSH